VNLRVCKHIRQYYKKKYATKTDKVLEWRSVSSAYVRDRPAFLIFVAYIVNGEYE
jgi:hypothetical protein